MTHYQRPGLVALQTPGVLGPGRGIWQASNGQGYAVVGSNLYSIGPPPTWTMTLLTAITPVRVNPCSLTDNGIEALLVDGEPAVAGAGGGWRINLATQAVTPMNDASWTGADRVDYIDSFVLWNQPGTKNFGSTLSNQIVPLDPTYVAGKTNYPDALQTLIVNRHEILLPGLFKSELWYDAGNPQFPFAELPGAYIEHGIGAKYSLAAADINVYWLGRDLQSGNQGMIMRQRGYETKRISNHAVEYQLQEMQKTGAALTDAIAYTYQQGGHVFYVISFPSGNQTWAYDATIEDPELAWTQRAWTGLDGSQNRDRVVLGAALYGVNCGLDWQNGTLYQLDPDTYTDTVSGVAGPVVYTRTFPHLMSGTDPKSGQPVLANGCMVQHTRFLLDAQCGTSSQAHPQFNLRWSDDRGVTWGQTVLQTAGELGQYITRPEWTGTGMAMDRVYEVSWSFPGKVALQGAWVDGVVQPR